MEKRWSLLTLVLPSGSSWPTVVLWQLDLMRQWSETAPRFKETCFPLLSYEVKLSQHDGGSRWLKGHNDPKVTQGLIVISIIVFTCLNLQTLADYLSLLLRRSVVSGSCWMVWCNIRASRPALFVMAVLTLRSCSKSSSSLYHCQTRTFQKQRAWNFNYGISTVIIITLTCIDYYSWFHHKNKNKLALWLVPLTTRTRSRSTSALLSFSQL